jgi:hypothetical protein
LALTRFDVFFFKMFFTSKYLAVVDLHSKILVNYTCFGEFLQPLWSPCRIFLVLRRWEFKNTDTFSSSTRPTTYHSAIIAWHFPDETLYRFMSPWLVELCTSVYNISHLCAQSLVTWLKKREINIRLWSLPRFLTMFPLYKLW